MAGVIRLFLTACSLKTLSIPSLLELLLGKDLSHIKVLSFGNALPEELKGIVSATKLSRKLKELYTND